MWDRNAEPLFYGFKVQRFRVLGSAPPLASNYRGQMSDDRKQIDNAECGLL